MTVTRHFSDISAFGLSMLYVFTASAQLATCDQIEIDPVSVPGSCITKSLNEQVGAGQGDVNTFGSSIYLINRDPLRSVRRGRQLFSVNFLTRRDLGHGSTLTVPETLHRHAHLEPRFRIVVRLATDGRAAAQALAATSLRDLTVATRHISSVWV